MPKRWIVTGTSRLTEQEDLRGSTGGDLRALVLTVLSVGMFSGAASARETMSYGRAYSTMMMDCRGSLETKTYEDGQTTIWCHPRDLSVQTPYGCNYVPEYPNDPSIEGVLNCFTDYEE